MIVSTIFFWHPIASMVTIHSTKSKASIKAGMAVISFDFSSTFSCPKVMPLADAQALTMCSFEKLLLSCFSEAPQMVLPSIGTTPLYWPQISRIHTRKELSSNSGLRMEKRRLNVSWEGTPLKSLILREKNSFLACPNSSMSYQLSAPAKTAAMVI